MTKKFIIVIEDEPNINSSETVQSLLSINKLLLSSVAKHKNKITEYHNNRLWDKYKKIGNEYELIFTTPNTGSNVSNYNPVSRSFFKLWEILVDHNEVIFPSNTSTNGAKCLFLAEGPGGFAEACIKFRNNKKDTYSGISLKAPNDKNVPDWKLQKDFMKKVAISYGEDGTGNLYNYKNILHLQKQLGENSQDFITADGGFDFSADFNSQEDVSFRLIMCEILTALLLQKQGGAFVLKIFDAFNENTCKLLQVLKHFYRTMYITKPLTSRPANSEKYVLCTGFRPDPKNTVLTKMIPVIQNYNEKSIKAYFSNITFNTDFLSNLITFNIQYTIRQVYCIEKTIYYINNRVNEEDITAVLDDNIRKSKKWCLKYVPPPTSS